MPHPDQTRFDLADTVTVYVLAADGVLLDVIEDVDLGDPIEASRNGRPSLREAALWGALAARHHRHAPADEDGRTSARRARRRPQ